MLERLKSLPIVVYLVVFLILLAPAYKEVRASTLESRIAHHCTDPKLLLEDCYIDYYKDAAEHQGSRTALRTLNSRKIYDEKLRTNCHEAMHEIGRASYVEYGSIAEAYAHADYSCWGGYLHGVVEASLRGKKMDDISSTTLRTMCDAAKTKGETSFEHFSCVHGIGHALMFVSNNDLPASLLRCDDLADSWESGQCANGAFMQNMFSKYNDHASDYLPKDDLHFPCSIARSKDQGACYQVQGRLILDAYEWDFAKSFAFCATLETKELRFSCGSGLGAAVSNTSAYNPRRIKKLCTEAQTLKQDCLYGAMTDLEGVVGNTDLGNSVCALEETSEKTACTDTLLRAHKDFPGSINERL